MAVNIYDTANAMEEDLRHTTEYTNLVAAYAEMKKDEKAYQLFKDFQEVQVNLQQKQMNGEELSDDEMAHARDIAGQVGNVEVIKSLMDKERNLNQLLNDINQIITKPIQELYHD
ncbi:YlbF family regulator [Pediococcus siamensis]|uniref:YlbF family regulator n=1 Tax=Pediococcus siamensis TaxID=381829 RepID=UPI0039A26C13